MKEGFPQAPKPVQEQARASMLENLLSETPIHGFGHERFTDSEKTDIDALLSSAGSGFDDPVFKNLPGEAAMDLMTYARSAPGTPERTGAAASVKAAIEQGRIEYYK